MAKRISPENIGAALGQLAKQIDSWKKQRDVLITEGERVAALAMDYVRDLRGHSAPGQVTGAAGRKGKGGRPKGMKMSEETKAKLRAAWKRRKARMTKAPVADNTKPIDARAIARSTDGRKWRNRQGKKA